MIAGKIHVNCVVKSLQGGGLLRSSVPESVRTDRKKGQSHPIWQPIGARNHERTFRRNETGTDVLKIGNGVPLSLRGMITRVSIVAS